MIEIRELVILFGISLLVTGLLYLNISYLNTDAKRNYHIVSGKLSMIMLWVFKLLMYITLVGAGILFMNTVFKLICLIWTTCI